MRVFIVGGDNALAQMWRGRGHDVVYRISEAEIVQFIGGADIDPELYGERKLPSTSCYRACDDRDQDAWNQLIPTKHFAVGVCRGGQFLNVMNGGSMWQHVSGHTGNHEAIDCLELTKRGKLTVTSTHHQMMIPAASGEVLCYAEDLSRNHLTDTANRVHDGIDPEVVWYHATRSLCFQPHPEYQHSPNACTDYFFDLIDLLK